MTIYGGAAEIDALVGNFRMGSSLSNRVQTAPLIGANSHEPLAVEHRSYVSSETIEVPGGSVDLSTYIHHRPGGAEHFHVPATRGKHLEIAG